MAAPFYNYALGWGVDLGASGGPTFSTEVIRTDNGAESRTPRWTDPLRQFNLGNQVVNMTQKDQLLAFFYKVQGRYMGFRFRDWTDWTTRSVQQFLGTGNGVQTVWQLRKSYSATGYAGGAGDPYRTITLPVANTTQVYKDGVLQTGSSGGVPAVSVSTTTGLVTFGAWNTPGVGAVITATFDFDTPARFDTDTLDFTMVAHRTGDKETLFQLGSCPLVEVRL